MHVPVRPRPALQCTAMAPAGGERGGGDRGATRSQHSSGTPPLPSEAPQCSPPGRHPPEGAAAAAAALTWRGLCNRQEALQDVVCNRRRGGGRKEGPVVDTRLAYRSGPRWGQQQPPHAPPRVTPRTGRVRPVEVVHVVVSDAGVREALLVVVLLVEAHDGRHALRLEVGHEVLDGGRVVSLSRRRTHVVRPRKRKESALHDCGEGGARRQV